MREVKTMTGNEFIKNCRLQKGYSVRQFGKMADITPRMVSYYESGEKLLEHLPVYKCITMFRLLDISVEDFFNKYYSIDTDMEMVVTQWNKEHPIDLDFNNLKKRIYARIAQIKSRRKITADNLESIYDLYNDFFSRNPKNYIAGQSITFDDYDKYIVPIYHHIKAAMNTLPDEKIARTILDQLYKTNYTISDICVLCGITVQRLNDYLYGKRDFSSIHVDTALKVCYVLGLDFEDLFGSCGKYN